MRAPSAVLFAATYLTKETGFHLQTPHPNIFKPYATAQLAQAQDQADRLASEANNRHLAAAQRVQRMHSEFRERRAGMCAPHEICSSKFLTRHVPCASCVCAV